jgi:hypothetical protein
VLAQQLATFLSHMLKFRSQYTSTPYVRPRTQVQVMGRLWAGDLHLEEWEEDPVPTYRPTLLGEVPPPYEP